MTNKRIRIQSVWFWLCCWLLGSLSSFAQTGTYVVSGGEFSNVGKIDLSASASWATDRSATPGYFAAYGTASYSNASDASHVNGYVKHYVQAANQGFTFPVGSGTDLRTLTTSGTISNSVVYATAWIAGNPGTTTDPTDGASHSTSSLGTGITGVSTAGQWDWVVSAGSAAGVTVTVSLPDVSSFGPAAQLRLVGWNGSQWVNLSGSTGASGNTENSTLGGTLVNGITALGIGLGIGGSPAAGVLNCLKTQILPAPVAGVPGQIGLLVEANMTAPGTFSVSVSGSGMTLANGVTAVNTTTTGVQKFNIPLNYDGSALGPLTFTVGAAGTCTADLAGISPKPVVTTIWTLNNCVSITPGILTK